MHRFYLVVELTQSYITRKVVENPNGLEADLPNNRFKCFTNIEVIISNHVSSVTISWIFVYMSINHFETFHIRGFMKAFLS